MTSLFSLANRAWLAFGLVATASVLTGLPSAASAQEGVSQEAYLEEIIVTAARREQNLQSVGLAVTAFSGEELREQGIFDIKGVTERTPGFSMGEFNPGQTQLFIRGIGSNEDGAAGDQSVVVFVDEVYIGRSAGQDVDLFDLERVEVLRGPQGTLFGRNVVGGAVSLITKKPGEEPELTVEGSYGNYNALTLRGLASGPIGENLYGKISFSSRRRDGYLENHIGQYSSFYEGQGISSFEFEDKDPRKIDRDSFRAALRYVPGDNVEINLTANYSTLDEFGAVRHFIGGNGAVLHPAHSALVPDYDSNIHAVLADDLGRFTLDIWGVTARLDWDLNDNLTFTSLSAYRDVESTNLEHGLGTPTLSHVLLSSGAIPFAADGFNDYIDNSQTFTQELRLTSSGESRLQWVAGLYFLDEDVHRHETASIGIKIPIGGGNFLDGPGFNISNSVAGDDQRADTTSYAAFAQATYDITDALSLTVGGRYTKDDKEINRVGVPNGVSITEAYTASAEDDWSEFTGKVSIGYQLTEDIYLYGTFSEGYKSGGYQGLAARKVQAETPFQPEFATLYEGGAKTEWFDNRLRVNIAGFFTDYKDLQILQLLVPAGAPPGTPGTLFTQNAANAEVSGVEVEFVLAATENLTLQGSITALDTEFIDFFAPAGFTSPGGGAGGQSRIGNELRNAPDLAYNLLARYRHKLPGGSEMTYQMDFRHKDQVNQDPDNLDFASIPEYDVADVRIAWSNRDGSVEIAGWVTNLFDEKYFIHNFPGLGDGLATAGPPRMYGMTFTWRQ